jgi:ribulose-phosphate 3-epimerase
MTEIIPAVLPYTFSELERALEKVRGLSQFVQIDITDGKFAGKPSWPLAKLDQNFEAILREERGLPFWEDFDFEIDLMVSDPFPLARNFIAAGVTRIIFHAESLDLDEDALLLDQIKTEGLVEVGIAVRSSTDEDKIKECMPYADFFQVMTIDPIGAQGSPFDPHSLTMISWLKTNFPNTIVTVDGAMTPETIELAYNAGAVRFAVGHYIFGSENPRGAFEEIQNLL